MIDERYGEYVVFRGGKIPSGDRDRLLAIPSTVRWLTQGGISRGSLSAKTHYGLGAFDVDITGMTRVQVWTMASEMLRSAIVPFPRGFVWDSFQGKTLNDIHDGNEHLHCCSWASYEQLHQQAKDQIQEYLRGGDGLTGSAKYTGPSTKLERWSTSPYNPVNRVPDIGVYTVTAVGGLWGLDVDRNKVILQPDGYRIQAAQRVKRWGRDNVVTTGGTYYAAAFLKTTVPSAPTT